MKTRAPLLAIAIVAALAVTASAADKYTADPSHSTIGFGVKHMVVTTVKGRFAEFEGHAMLDQNDMSQSSVEITISVASLDTGHEKRDKDLRGEGFFTTEKFPNITFVSTRIEKKGDGLVAHGKLTIRGVSKDVEIPFELSGPIDDPWGNTRFGISGALKVKRKDYGLNYDNKLADGGMIVSDDVKIELDIEFVMPKQEG